MFQKVANLNAIDRKLAIKNDKLSQLASKIQPQPYTYELPQPSTRVQSIVDQNAIDRALLIKNERIGQNARPRVNKPKKNMTGIDEEILKEYQQSKPQSFEYTDEEGNTKYRKYLLPNSKPELYPEEEYIAESDLQDVKAYQEQEKEHILGIMERVKEELEYNLEQQRRLTEYINQGGVKGQTFGRDERERIANLNRDKDDLQYLKNVELQLRNEITEGHALLQNEDTKLKQVEENFYQKNAEVAKIKQANKEIANRYRDELNFLNQGAFSTEKADNESEMEYLERLQRNAQIEAPEYQLEDAKFSTISTFRIKMKELIRDPVLIEQVSNRLDPIDSVDNRARLLKSWGLVKSKFIQTYGVNNKNLTASDIITFFEYFLTTGESGLSKAVESVLGIKNEIPEAQIGFKDTIDAIPLSHEDCLMLENRTAMGEKRLFLKAVNDGSNKYLLYSFSGETGTYKEYFDEKLPSYRKGSSQSLSSERASGKSSEEIKRETGITLEKLGKVFGIVSLSKMTKTNQELIVKKMKEMFGISSVSIADPRVLRKPYSTEARGKKDQIEYGMGLRAEQIPARVPFGNVNILLKKLYYHNELSVKNKQDKSIAGLRTTKVSEPFVKLIMNMLHGLQPTHADLNHMSSGERQLYDRLVQVANLNKEVPHHGDKTIQDLKKRLKLIEGEIEIGNNNPMLVKEIYSILHSLKDFKVITQGQIDKYMKQFK
jgi:hypothetical protein